MNAVLKALGRVGLEPFIVILLASIFLAWLGPEIGMKREPFCLGDVANLGMAFIFFFYGLRIDKRELVAGLVNIKLHALVHFSTFVLFPIIVLLAMYAGGISSDNPHYYLWMGVFFLAALPSTVSSSVVMVSLAGGNIPVAIFNASVSSLLGVFITPLWMGMYLDNIEGSAGMGDIVFKLVLQVIVPIVAGLLLNDRFNSFAVAHKKALRNFDQSVIILIVYTSFCDSFHDGMFDGFLLLNLIWLFAGLLALFFLVFGIILAICRAIGLNRPDTIAVLFCGSKKSLVHGTIMSRVIFGNSTVLGVILLPTMIYHALQLVIVSIIAQQLGKSLRAETAK